MPDLMQATLFFSMIVNIGALFALSGDNRREKQEGFIKGSLAGFIIFSLILLF